MWRSAHRCRRPGTHRRAPRPAARVANCTLLDARLSQPKYDHRQVVRLARADFFGRTTDEARLRQFEAGKWLLHEAEALDVRLKAPAPLIQGRDLIKQGLTPSSEFKGILAAAYDAQLEGDFSDKADAMHWLENYLKER